MSCTWCDAGNTRVVSSLDPLGETFVHHTPVGRVLCGEAKPVSIHGGTKVVWCCWCRSLRVTPGRSDDHLTVTIAGDTRIAILNGDQIIVQDGMCVPCAAAMKAAPEKVSS